MRVLGIETSCDETAAAVVEGGRWVRSSVVSSQMALHAAYGGVVPELAAREQVTAIVPVVRAALAEAGVTLGDIDGIAVTTRPGLAGSLLVGVNAAKAMGYAAGVPVVGVHHLAGHIAACWLVGEGESGKGKAERGAQVEVAGGEDRGGALAAGGREPARGSPTGGSDAGNGADLEAGSPSRAPLRGAEAAGRGGGAAPTSSDIPLPAVCLVVSGGHTLVVKVREDGGLEVLGETIDDAAGEAFDKAARLLGLGYPGGPVIQRAAEGGDPRAIPMPRAWLGESLDFSFSGLKTALLREVAPYRLPEAAAVPVSEAPSAAPFAEHRPPRFAEGLPVADLAAGFQAAVVDVLAAKTVRAARLHGARSVLVAGGVAANAALRRRLAELSAEELGPDVPVRWPAVRLCTDNAAMIAAAGTPALRRGEAAGLDLDIAARAPLTDERVIPVG